MTGKKRAVPGSPRYMVSLGRVVAQRLDAGFPPRRPGFAYGQHVVFVVDKAGLGQVFSEYFGFPRQSFHLFFHYHKNYHSSSLMNWNSFILVSCLAYSSTLKMEVVCSSETSVEFQRTT
jgi:hypothetical protein